MQEPGPLLLLLRLFAILGLGKGKAGLGLEVLLPDSSDFLELRIQDKVKVFDAEFDVVGLEVAAKLLKSH